MTATCTASRCARKATHIAYAATIADGHHVCAVHAKRLAPGVKVRDIVQR